MSDAVLRLLSYDADAQALICLNASCRYALQASAVRQHLQDIHHVELALVQEAAQYVATLRHVCAPAQLPLLVHGSPQHPLLRVYSVFQCHHCSCIMRHRKSIKMHGNQVHTLRNATDAERFTSAKAQSWTAGKAQRYWIVDAAFAAAPQLTAPVHIANNAETTNSLTQIMAQTSAKIQEQVLQRRQLTQTPTADELSPWLKHTGWNAALTMSVLTFQQLAAFKRQPDSAETDLRRLTASFDRIVQRATATMAETDADLLL